MFDYEAKKRDLARRRVSLNAPSMVDSSKSVEELNAEESKINDNLYDFNEELRKTQDSSTRMEMGEDYDQATNQYQVPSYNKLFERHKSLVGGTYKDENEAGKAALDEMQRLQNDYNQRNLKLKALKDKRGY